MMWQRTRACGHLPRRLDVPNCLLGVPLLSSATRHVQHPDAGHPLSSLQFHLLEAPVRDRGSSWPCNAPSGPSLASRSVVLSSKSFASLRFPSDRVAPNRPLPARWGCATCSTAHESQPRIRPQISAQPTRACRCRVTLSGVAGHPQPSALYPGSIPSVSISSSCMLPSVHPRPRPHARARSTTEQLPPTTNLSAALSTPTHQVDGSASVQKIFHCSLRAILRFF
ncbi:hypothetical protein LXA43DRAFT_563926 [Ganoderma leucocontextum]|nr:hypothetical protein LXA43DRAFT_563926 [Ganoderma leucocontextum]